jgi:hypothetical protein
MQFCRCQHSIDAHKLNWILNPYLGVYKPSAICCTVCDCFRTIEEKSNGD